MPRRQKIAVCKECGEKAINIYRPFNISYGGYSTCPRSGMFSIPLGKWVDDPFDYPRQMREANLQEISVRESEAVEKQRKRNRCGDLERATNEAKKYCREKIQEGVLKQRR